MVQYENEFGSLPRRVIPVDQSGWGMQNSRPAGQMLPAAGEVGRSQTAPLGMRAEPQGMRPQPELSMQNGLSEDALMAPTTVAEAYRGSWKAMLAKNVGNYIVASFLMGTQIMTSWEGTLYDVGNDYIVIYQEGRDRYIAVDYYSLKSVEFYDTERRRLCNAVLQERGWGPAIQ